MVETRALYISTADIQAAEGIDAWAAGLRRRVQILRDDLWNLIDYIATGYERYGDLIYQYVDEVDLSLSRLRNYCTTGRNFPPSRRGNLPALSPAHFELVNGLEEEDQYDMLWIAYSHDLSRDGLQAELRQRGLINSRTVPEVMLENDYQHARIKRLERDLETARAEADSLQATAGNCPACGGRLVCYECGGEA